MENPCINCIHCVFVPTSYSENGDVVDADTYCDENMCSFMTEEGCYKWCKYQHFKEGE